jgi:hypothetical protein
VFLFPAQGGVDAFLKQAKTARVEQLVVLSSLTVVMEDERANTSLFALHHLAIEKAVIASGIPCGRKLDHSVGDKTGQRGEKMTEVMRRILPYGSASSHLPAACLPIEWYNFLTIRPLHSRIYKRDNVPRQDFLQPILHVVVTRVVAGFHVSPLI